MEGRKFFYQTTFILEEISFSSSSVENLFKLYDGVETFAMFIGYPRSSHSLVAAILDAHPEVIIAYEYHVVENWQKYYKSFKVAQKNLKKYHLF